MKHTLTLLAFAIASATSAQTAAPSAPAPKPALAFVAQRSYGPLNQWRGSEASELSLRNSDRLQQLIVNGKLQLTLRDALALALENNLDLAIARYNQPIADTDILRTLALR